MHSSLRLLLLVLLLGLGGWAAQRVLRVRAAADAPCVAAPCASGQEQALAPSPTPLPTTPPPTATPLPTPIPSPTATPEVLVVPYGSVDENGNVIPTPTPRPVLMHGPLLVERYGDTRFPSLDAMPDEVRLYVTVTAQDVADFFGVRAEDLLALLQAQNEGGFRLFRSGEEGATPRGVAQMPVGLWNGWASPHRDRYETSQRTLEQFGGFGFDWGSREVWRGWTTGERSYAFMSQGGADPDQFENSVAALARYLLSLGLTRDHAATAPEAHLGGLAEAAARLQEEPRFGAVVAAPASDGAATPSPALRAAFAGAMDRAYGVALTEEELALVVDRSSVAAEVAAGRLSADEGSQQLLAQVEARWMEEARAARASGRPLPWPFAEDEQQLAVQRTAVRLMGHTLSPWQLSDLLQRTGGEPGEVERRLSNEVDAQLFERTRERLDQALQRSARGLPLRTHEVASLVLPTLLPSHNLWLGRWGTDELMAQIEYQLRRLPEFRELNGDMVFEAQPLDPMPNYVFPFGITVSYQPGGFHTGIDARGQRRGGQEPLLYAVDEGTVTYVGPLYCLREDACRGPYAIVIHHGNHVYSIYSHNSEAHVRAGDAVTAGQPIGRQGNEGYSRRSHLHFEVHVGAPFSGDWTQPFLGGEFVDPVPWLPRT